MANPFDGRREPDVSGQQIGEHGLLAFIDDLNSRRAQLGVNQRYRPVRIKGQLTAEWHYLPRGSSPHAASPVYSAPRLVHAQ